MYGQYKRIKAVWENGVLTGKGLSYGGSLIRPEATGYGACYYAENMLACLLYTSYMLVVGDREAEQGEVSVRSRAGGDLGAMKVDDFAAMLREEIDTKSIK